MLTVEIYSDTEWILSELTSDDRSAADVIGEAIRLAAGLRRAERDRVRWMEQASADAQRLADDPADRAEIEAIMRDMENLRFR
ncbi:hypothetical protein ACFQVD_00245 [Streptosporangium amethystogenes subsp. fukuiense]|uniref:Antitoxin n=1 Tax=Streptosporangium amethystogenes subsp. fukuiense TaxID=698418 RepID=A0ABW2SQF6_9ACTN